MSGPERFDDTLLDEILGDLGTPPAAVPRADTGAILARAALLGAPTSAAVGVVTAGLAGWKLWGALVVVGSLAFGGGWSSRPAPSTTAVAPAVVQEAPTPLTEAPTRTAYAPGVWLAPLALPAAETPAPPVIRIVHVPVAESSNGCPEVPGPVLSPMIADASGLDRDEPWPEDTPDEQTEPDEPLADDAVPVLPPLHEDPVSSDASARATATPRAGRPRLSLAAGIGAAGGLGGWGPRAPAAGPEIRGDLAVLGPSPGLVRPTVRIGAELAMLAGGEEYASRFVGGLQVSGGLVVGRKRARFELVWAGGARVMPPSTEANSPDDEEAGWLFGLTGAELGLVVGREDRAAFRAALSGQFAVLDLNGDGRVSLAPWVGLTVGADIPLPGPAR